MDERVERMTSEDRAVEQAVDMAEDERKLEKRTEDERMTVEYIRACIIWTLFGCKTMENNHDVYL